MSDIDVYLSLMQELTGVAAAAAALLRADGAGVLISDSAHRLQVAGRAGPSAAKLIHPDDDADHRGTSALHCTPVIVSGAVVGHLHALHRHPHGWSDDDGHMARRYGDLAGELLQTTLGPDPSAVAALADGLSGRTACGNADVRR